MEAVAKHDFNANEVDELSFRKSQILKVSDGRWFFFVRFFFDQIFYWCVCLPSPFYLSPCILYLFVCCRK